MAAPLRACLPLALTLALTVALTGCIPDKPMEDPTPVGGRPTPTPAPIVASPEPGASPVAVGAPAIPTAASASGAVEGKVGEVVKNGPLTVTLNSVDRGESLLTVNISVENTSDQDVFMNASVEFTMQSGAAGSLASPTLFGVAQPRFDSNLKRNQKSTGNIAFQVPRAADNVVFSWRAPQSQGGRVLATWQIAGT